MIGHMSFRFMSHNTPMVISQCDILLYLMVIYIYIYFFASI